MDSFIFQPHFKSLQLEHAAICILSALFTAAQGTICYDSLFLPLHTYHRTPSALFLCVFQLQLKLRLNNSVISMSVYLICKHVVRGATLSSVMSRILAVSQLLDKHISQLSAPTSVRSSALHACQAWLSQISHGASFFAVRVHVYGSGGGGGILIACWGRCLSHKCHL